MVGIEELGAQIYCLESDNERIQNKVCILRDTLSDLLAIMEADMTIGAVQKTYKRLSIIETARSVLRE